MKIGHVKSKFRVSIFKVSIYRFRRLKVLILTFTDVFLFLTDSPKKKGPIPLILLYLEIYNFMESARVIGHFRINTFGRLSGIELKIHSKIQTWSISDDQITPGFFISGMYTVVI